jgi:hypothetical protein
MMRTLAVLILLCVVSLPMPVAGESPATANPEAMRNNAALAMITFPWQEQLEYQIVFLDPQNGYRAMTYPKQHRIEIYARPGDNTARLAHDIAHELGHAVDVTFNTPDLRKKWMELRGIDPASAWFACNKCSDFSSPAGDFAETFALLQVGSNYFAGRIAPRPTDADIPALISFFSFLPKDAFPAPKPATKVAGRF